jgi:hypothetical protein
MRVLKMMFRDGIYLFLLAFTVACDPPPAGIIDGDFAVDSDTESDMETSDTGSETDSETTVDTESDTLPEVEEIECFEAMICIAMMPESALECLDGLSEEDRKAAMSLATCLLQGCMDNLDDLAGIATCLLVDCSEEMISCIGFSMF